MTLNSFAKLLAQFFLFIYFAFMILALTPLDATRLQLLLAQTEGVTDIAFASPADFSQYSGPDFFGIQVYGEPIGAWFKRTHVVFGGWFKQLLWHFHFGYSAVDKQAVGPKILAALPHTLFLNVGSLILVWIISVLLAFAMQKKVWQKFFEAVFSILQVLPGFWVAQGLLFLLASSEFISLFPFAGTHSLYLPTPSLGTKILDYLWHMSLPLLTLVVLELPGFIFLMRERFEFYFCAEFIKTARAKGLSEFHIFKQHVLKIVSLDLLGWLGRVFPALLGGSVLIESIFQISGMGRFMMLAMQSRDQNAVMAVTVWVVGLTLVLTKLLQMISFTFDARLNRSL